MVAELRFAAAPGNHNQTQRLRRWVSQIPAAALQRPALLWQENDRVREVGDSLK
jgi:hypothetical protein